MSVQQLINHEMLTRPASDGNGRFLRTKIEIEWQGENSHGKHDTICTVHLYDSISDKDTPLVNMDMLTYLLQSQLTAHNVPDLLVFPNFYHNIDSQDNGQITHHAYVWDENVDKLKLDLTPYFSVEKCIYIKERFINPMKMHNIYLLVSKPKQESNSD